MFLFFIWSWFRFIICDFDFLLLFSFMICSWYQSLFRFSCLVLDFGLLLLFIWSWFHFIMCWFDYYLFLFSFLNLFLISVLASFCLLFCSKVLLFCYFDFILYFVFYVFVLGCVFTFYRVFIVLFCWFQLTFLVDFVLSCYFVVLISFYQVLTCYFVNFSGIFWKINLSKNCVFRKCQQSETITRILLLPSNSEEESASELKTIARILFGLLLKNYCNCGLWIRLWFVMFGTFNIICSFWVLSISSFITAEFWMLINGYWIILMSWSRRLNIPNKILPKSTIKFLKFCCITTNKICPKNYKKNRVPGQIGPGHGPFKKVPD